MANKYIGYNEEELNNQEYCCKLQISSYDTTIEQLEKKLKEQKKAKKAIEKKLVLINEARNYCSDIELEVVIRIDSKTKSKYVGKTEHAYYYNASDYKEYKVYKFYVYKCNVVDNSKGIEKLYTSREYTYEEKKDMTKLILEMIRTNNIKKCYVNNNIKIAKAAIEKLGCKVIEN